MENNYENITFSNTRLNPEPDIESGFVNYQEKLIEYAKKRGNNFRFITPEIIIHPENLPSKVNWKRFVEDLTAEQKEEIEYGFNFVNKFPASPIFTDVFSGNHDARREWERKYLGGIGPEEIEIYKSNRLGLSFSLGLKNFITANEQNFKPEALDYLQQLTSYISDNLLDADLYLKLSDSEKIIEINQLTLIYLEAIKYIGLKDESEN